MIIPGWFPAGAVAGKPPLEVIGTNQNEANSASSINAALPANIESGDLLVVFLSVMAGGVRSITTPTGWTPLYNEVVAGDFRRAAAYQREADGSEGASQTFLISASSDISSLSYLIRGWSEIDVNTSNGGSGTTTTPDPPSLSPSFTGQLWLATAHGRAGSARTVTNFPANYTDGFQQPAGGALEDDNLNTASARRFLSAATENPGAFTYNGVVFWLTSTIAIR